MLSVSATLLGCSGDGSGPAEPETGVIEGTVILDGFGPLPDALVRLTKVGGSTVHIFTDDQGAFRHDARTGVWDVSVVGTDGFAPSDTVSIFVPPNETTVFGSFVVQRLVYDVEIRDGAFVPEVAFIGAHAIVRWTNFDADPHDISFWPQDDPRSPVLAQNEQFEFIFESGPNRPYRCSLHDIEGFVYIDWDPSS